MTPMIDVDLGWHKICHNFNFLQINEWTIFKPSKKKAFRNLNLESKASR